MTEAVEVNRFWGRLGLPGLVDVHTHFMPEQVLRKVWAYFDALGEATGGALEWPITYRDAEVERVARIREFEYALSPPCSTRTNPVWPSG